MRPSAVSDAVPAEAAGHESRPLFWASTALGTAALVPVVLGLLVALTLPYGDYDAMAFGIWSRLLAEHLPTFHFTGGLVPAAAYHRPLFLVAQGLLWSVFGFHETLGRALSLSFALVLVASVGGLAAWRAGRYRRLAAALAVAVALTTTELLRNIASGLTDVPAAAAVAVTAVALVARRRLGRWHLPAVALAAALAGLAKPSAFPALAGLALAVALGPRSGLRRRLPAVGALAAGTLVALVYDRVQAGWLHLGLLAFLRLGTGGVYAQQASAARRDTLLDGAWLGAALRVVLLFAIVYALLRLARLGHRPATLAAAPLAWVLAWLGPHLAGAQGLRVGILGTGGPWEQAACLVLAAALLLALDAPEESVPGRLELARLLAWGAPPFVVWSVYAVYDLRLAAPFWPAAIVLVARALLPVCAGALRRRRALLAVPVAALAVLVLANAESVGGLGGPGWNDYRSNGWSGLTNPASQRSIGLGGDFGAEMAALASQIRSGGRILTPDDRVPFFYLDRTTVAMPQTCADLRGYRLFLVLESDELRASQGARAGTAFWLACTSPRLTLVDERRGAFALFVSGLPHPAGAGSCGAPAPTPGLAVEFGRFRTAAAAQALLEKIAALGFVQAKVEQLGCASYRVVETGIPNRSIGKAVVKEAASVHLAARLVNGP